MITYLLRRLAEMIPVLFIISIVVFSLVFLIPGDPVIALLGPSTTRSIESIEKEKERLGLNDPVPVQYARWLGKALRGDLGRSASTKQPVADALHRRLPVTIQLAVFTVVISVAFALPFGVLAALKSNSVWDVIVTLISVLGISIPNFWLAILLIIIFALQLQWLPASGYVSITQAPIASLKHMLLPAIALGGSMAAGTMRFLRSSLLEVLRDDYIRTAYAKGLSGRIVVIRHALKPSLIPVITLVGVEFGRLIGGSLIIESIFLVPGVGSLMVNAIFRRDFPTIQSGALVLAVIVILINLLVDLLYGYLDPRIRYE